MPSETYNTAHHCPLLICKEQPLANQTPTLHFRENKNLWLPLKNDIKLEFTTCAYTSTTHHCHQITRVNMVHTGSQLHGFNFLKTASSLPWKLQPECFVKPAFLQASFLSFLLDLVLENAV